MTLTIGVMVACFVATCRGEPPRRLKEDQRCHIQLTQFKAATTKLNQQSQFVLGCIGANPPFLETQVISQGLVISIQLHQCSCSIYVELSRMVSIGSDRKMIGTYCAELIKTVST